MTYLGKRKDSDKRESVKAENNAVNLLKKDDILKQSIKAAEFEDTSVFFVHSDSGRVDFIVGGIIHTVLLKSLYATLPASRIGKLLRSTTLEEVLSYCDKYETEGRQHPTIMFDRNGASFNTILDIYRTGMFHLCDSTCATIRKDDLDFWSINELLLEPCCALKYFPDIEVCEQEAEGERMRQEKEQERAIEEDFGNSKLGRLRSFCWNMTEYPETGRAAQVSALFSLAVVIISTITFIMSTMEEFQIDEETGTSEYPEMTYAIDFVDNSCAVYFAMEYFMRLLCSPKKIKFFLNGMNFIDFLALIPLFLTILLESIKDLAIMGKAGKIIRLVRVMRIMRIFKLVRHFAGLQSLIYTLNQAYKELGLLLLLIAVSLLTIASMTYFVEKEASQWTFIDSFWYSLMTLTTVGYELHPKSTSGKMVGGMCALLGVFILTLPLPIVVNSFSTIYKNRLWRNEVAQKKAEKLKVLGNNRSNSEYEEHIRRKLSTIQPLK